MSTRDDATLSASERAAFARIEAQAIAEDPRLGASLAFRVGQRLRRMAPAIGRVVRLRGFAPLLVAVGLGLLAAGLVTSLALSVAGLVALVVGVVPLAELAGRKAEAARARAVAARAPSPPDPA